MMGIVGNAHSPENRRLMDHSWTGLLNKLFRLKTKQLPSLPSSGDFWTNLAEVDRRFLEVPYATRFVLLAVCYTRRPFRRTSSFWRLRNSGNQFSTARIEGSRASGPTCSAKMNRRPSGETSCQGHVNPALKLACSMHHHFSPLLWTALVLP